MKAKGKPPLKRPDGKERCHSWHIRGRCFTGCRHIHDHVDIAPAEQDLLWDCAPPNHLIHVPFRPATTPRSIRETPSPHHVRFRQATTPRSIRKTPSPPRSLREPPHIPLHPPRLHRPPSSPLTGLPLPRDLGKKQSRVVGKKHSRVVPQLLYAIPPPATKPPPSNALGPPPPSTVLGPTPPSTVLGAHPPSSAPGSTPPGNTLGPLPISSNALASPPSTDLGSSSNTLASPPSADLVPTGAVRRPPPACPPPGYPIDRLDVHITRAIQAYNNSTSWGEFIRTIRGRGDIHPNVDAIPNPAGPLLAHFGLEGTPASMHDPPWNTARIAGALARGLHQSSRQGIDFLREEYADVMDKQQWTALPASLILDLPNLRLSPLGLVPQRGRRPRMISDYTYSEVNQDTIPLAPAEAMQFGHTLPRLLSKLHRVNPRPS
eukprot:jgi/Psemu1/4840/gm1.4840_g